MESMIKGVILKGKSGLEYERLLHHVVKREHPHEIVKEFWRVYQDDR